MNYNPDIHHRRSIRMRGYDYASLGFYFVTICVESRENRFGTIENGIMIPNNAGKIIDNCWKELGNRYQHIRLDEYVIMPNHFHGIIQICRDTPCAYPVSEGQPCRDTPCTYPVSEIGQPTIGDIIGAFKSITTHTYIQNIKSGDFPAFEKRLWQRNYWEHVIRTESSLCRIREYIHSNPQNWESDSLY